MNINTPLPAYRGGLPYIFVCYAHADAERVYPEVRMLQDLGIRVWYDEGISAGRVWRGEIGDALLGARCLLYYLSHDALKSDHCNREVHLALDEGKDVLPIYLDEVVLPSDLKVGLARLQALFRWRDADYWQRLLRALNHPSDDIQPSQPASTTLRRGSIAVLPFINRSSDAEQEYFSDGIAEELLNLLTKVPELKVVSRRSAFSFKGQNLDAVEIARRLKVAHILEGSVRKAGNRVRITAQLIDAGSDTQQWSETYDRSLDDIFAIQDEIAATVVKQLKIVLLGAAPKAAPTSPEAYAVYLQARYVGMQTTSDGFARSNVLYQQALEIDPTYVAAWVGLSVNYGMQAYNRDRPFAETYQRAREMAEKALAIDPEHAPARARLGMIAMVLDRDLPAAARHFERALAREPTNLEILERAAMLLTGLGRLQDAIAVQEYRVAQDPVDPLGYLNLAGSYRFAGLWDQAITSFNTARRLSGGRILGAGDSDSLLLKGNPAAAIADLQQHPPGEARRLLGLAMAYHAMGKTDESDTALEEVIRRFEREWAYEVARAFAYRIEADRCFEWLAKSVEYGCPRLHEIPVENLFFNVHEDARWLPFLESIGKSPTQLAAIEFNVSLPA